MISGESASKLAADEVVRKGERLCGWMLETSEADIDFQRGVFRVKGTDRLLSLSDVAKKSYLGVKAGSEAGNVGSPVAIVNAIIDALSSLGYDGYACAGHVRSRLADDQ